MSDEAAMHESACRAMDLDALLDAVRTAPEGDALDAAWGEALDRVDLPGDGLAEDLLLPEELTAPQRRLAEALAARREGNAWTCRIPGTLRLVRRWLGLTPPSVLERRVPWTHEGREVSWPLWRVWREAPMSSREHNQGIPTEVAERLRPGELIEAAGETLLERYGDFGHPMEARLLAALPHAAEAAPWAREALAVLLAVHGEGPRDWARGYGAASFFASGSIALLTLLPLVRAGVPIDPAWDRVVPHAGPEAEVREVLMALPDDRREAAVYRAMSTAWGPNGDKVLNGFWENLRALSWAPSYRNARFVVSQWRHCRRYFAKSADRIRAALDALAADHPDVAEALKPHRRRAGDAAATETSPKKPPRRGGPPKSSPKKLR